MQYLDRGSNLLLSRPQRNVFALVRRLGLLGATLIAGAVVPAAQATVSASPPLRVRHSGRPARYVRIRPALSTAWTRQAQSSVTPLPDYPRPEMQRSQWMNLNGRWAFRSVKGNARPNFAAVLPRTILVPFAPQSALSGIERNSPRSFYERNFTVPPSWRRERILLHFGAVTYSTKVYVNGVAVGSHTGDFDSFTFDITRALKRGRNQLFVNAFDPGEAGGQPVGKQTVKPPGSVFFTAASGIWQTVWLEPVRSAHLTRLDTVPDPARDRVLVTPVAAGANGSRVVLRALDGRKVVGVANGRPGRAIALPVPRPKLWSPSRPFLYNLDAEVIRGKHVEDRVRSYFGMRTISLATVGGVKRIVLNGKFVFEDGVLDQGYWPDGIYTAPTDAALRFDLERQRALGFNMVRKHEKVEPDRWYYWADRLGILVWQDMPSMSPYLPPPSKAREREFMRELSAVVGDLQSHPSIVGWIPFNEGWGAFAPGAVIEAIKRLDPTRLLDGDSGSVNCCGAPEPGSAAAGGGSGGDLRDAHLYMGPYAPTPDNRAAMIGEYGNLVYGIAADEWNPLAASQLMRGFGWDRMPDPTAACRRYQQMAEMLRQEVRRPGVSAAVFTAWTDVEDEIDGVMTYDRQRYKCDPGVIQAENRATVAASQDPAKLRADAPAIPAGAVAYWRFDEGAGDVAHDASGHDENLTLQNGAGWGAGVHGASLSVGGGGQAAQIDTPLLDSGGDFTVAAWVQSADATHDGSAVSLEGTATNGFSLRLRGSRWSFAMAQRDVPRNPAGSGIACPPIDNCLVSASNRYMGLAPDARDNVVAGRWYYLAGVRRRATDSIVLYIDGNPVDSRWLGDTFTAAGPFSVGAGTGTGGAPDTFDGQIDDLRVWNRGLSSGDVSQLFRAEQARG